MMNEKWFAFSISELEKKFRTNAATGLSRKAARSAWRYFSVKCGSLFLRKKKSVGKMITDVLSDFALIMLLMVSVMAILFDEFYMGITVTVICLLNIAVSVFFYYHSEHSMERIEEYFQPTASVIRGGKLYRVSFDNVVPGDVILLQKGDIVCGDARLVTSDKLSVSMRIGVDNFISLEKQAQGVIRPDENDPTKYVNILHAGSIITSGNARAIVYATGKYTYLGALSGGIIEPYSNNVPTELRTMRKICSRISLFSILCILPFCVLSLLNSHMSGGTSTLSSAFVTALAIAATSMTQLSCTLCKLFFVKKIKKACDAQSSAVVRNITAFDNLTDIKYIFMLDGCAATDGVLHFETAFNAEGELKNFKQPTASATALLEAVSLYNWADTKLPTLGITPPNRFKSGISEMLADSCIDTKALGIRCSIISYYPGTITDPNDKVFFTDGGRKYVLIISHSADILSHCSHTVAFGKKQPMTGNGSDRLKHFFYMHTSCGKKVLIFSVAAIDNDTEGTDRCFIGAIVLREQTDPSANSYIKNLKSQGIKLISFPDVRNDVPSVPMELCGITAVHKNDFLKANLEITRDFGKFDAYYGFNENDIAKLLSFAQSQKQKVAVIGFTDTATSVIENADVFVSCSPTLNLTSAKDERELFDLESNDCDVGLSCAQTVRAAADILLDRPCNGRGGISALFNAIQASKEAATNLATFFRYILCVQLIRICMVALPMIFGNNILDARHVLFGGFIIDVFALLSFVNSNGRKRFRCLETTSLSSYIKNDKNVLVASFISALFAIISPLVAGQIDVIGAYLYRVEYMFVALIALQLTVLYYFRFGSIKKIYSLLKDKYMLLFFTLSVLFLIIVAVVPTLGLFFDFVLLPLQYLLLALLAPCIFALTLTLLNIKNTK